MDSFKKKFEENHKGNTLILQTLTSDAIRPKVLCERIAGDDMNRKMTDGLHMISSMYLYTNAPPHGYGTPAPKVAETVLRAYNYNCKDDNSSWNIYGKEVPNYAIKDIKDYPFDQITGNYHPQSVYKMAKEYLKVNATQIIEKSEDVIEMMKRTNPDILTKGRQTWDPESLKSITSAKAYKRFIETLTNNGMPPPTNCLEFILCYMTLFTKEVLNVKKRVVVSSNKNVYSREMKAWSKVLKKRMYIKKYKIKGKENVQKWVLDHTRSFCSYIKHGERGKKDRRAIASASIPLRMLLYIVEEFHLSLGKVVPGSTISIGGEEKKMKINQELFATSTKQTDTREFNLQATEDATKWNECLNPVMFGLVHNVFFDDQIRDELHISKVSDEQRLFGKICALTFSIMAIKRINLGHGVIVHNEKEYKRVNWNEVDVSSLNTKTQDWYSKISHYLEEDGYVFSSPGFLMGMLNAASTTIGLLPVGHEQTIGNVVTTLRSSDDSMTVFSSPSIDDLVRSIEINRKSLKLIGINPSTSKSFLFKKGYGEYTSWYQDGEFIAQYGVETSSLKPKGNNAQDDFNDVAIGTAILMRNSTINKMGAISRILVGVDNVRRLWKIKVNPHKRDLSKGVLFLADGGLCPWNLENLVIEEATIRYSLCKTKGDLEYFFKVMDPQNPFSDTPEEMLAWSKQTGSIVMSTIDTSRNVFCYVRRSNRTINNETSKLEAASEINHRQAFEIMVTADPSLHVRIPQSKAAVIDYVKASMLLRKSKVDLNDQELSLVESALRKLEGQKDEEDEEENDYVSDDLEFF